MNAVKLMLSMILAAGFVLGTSSVALAQEEGGEAPVETVYKKTTIIDFSDVTITGELTKPEGSYLMN